MAHTFVFGLVGPTCTAHARATWNRLLKEQGIDGFFDFYRAKNECELVTRLSEMFLLERRGYLIDASLQEAATALMDILDPSVEQHRVDTVRNERGVLTGYYLGVVPPAQILKIWMI